MDFTTALTVALLIGSAAVIFFVLLFVLRPKEKKEKKLTDLETPFKIEPLTIGRSIRREEAEKAREELRMLELEREILGDAIRKLYEAHAEGKITEEERDRLASHYKERMLRVRESIEKNQSLVALHELESMQEDLIKLFNERFDELNRKIEELRQRVQIQPIKEITTISIPATTETPTTPAKKQKTPSKRKAKKAPRKKPAESKKTEAERRIEEIKAEIEKVLARLGQMEIEA